MIMGNRLRELRTQKKLSQGDIQRRTGLFRCYISRVENGYTVPSVETLEKIARGLEVPLYQLFVEDERLPSGSPKRGRLGDVARGASEKDAGDVAEFLKLLAAMGSRDRAKLLHIARRIVKVKTG